MVKSCWHYEGVGVKFSERKHQVTLEWPHMCVGHQWCHKWHAREGNMYTRRPLNNQMTTRIVAVRIVYASIPIYIIYCPHWSRSPPHNHTFIKVQITSQITPVVLCFYKAQSDARQCPEMCTSKAMKVLLWAPNLRQTNKHKYNVNVAPKSGSHAHKMKRSIL